MKLHEGADGVQHPTNFSHINKRLRAQRSVKLVHVRLELLADLNLVHTKRSLAGRELVPARGRLRRQLPFCQCRRKAWGVERVQLVRCRVPQRLRVRRRALPRTTARLGVCRGKRKTLRR